MLSKPITFPRIKKSGEGWGNHYNSWNFLMQSCCWVLYLGMIIFSRFGFYKKKSNQTDFFIKKQKPKQVQTGLDWFFGLTRFFSVSSL
jgi:hypothetical protein